MKMATLSWTKLNPTIKFVDTKKAFFGQYLYKVIVRVPGGRLCQTASDQPMDILLAGRQQFVEDRKSYNWGGSWWHRYAVIKLNNANVDQLTHYRSIYHTKSDIKIRVEEPNITLYAKTEQELFDIVKNEQPSNILELHSPATADSAMALDRGEIIVKRPTEYTHKIVFKESGKFDHALRESVFNYLTSLGDTVHMTNSTKQNLSMRKVWFTQCYFYTKDDSILTFLNLMAPDAIAGIYKLTYLDQ